MTAAVACSPSTLQPNEAASTVLPFAKRRDPLGTTHHEAGTLWMGTQGSRMSGVDR